MNNHELKLLESVVQMTTARSIRPLEKKFTEIIYDLVDCKTVVLIRLPEINNINLLE